MPSPRAKATCALVAARDALMGFRSGTYPSSDELDRAIDQIEAALQTNFLVQAEP